ncbi:MAG: glutathione S-transferase family protein [Alphaproteobacteria bacterium]|mgnify:CR=1 FL=1|nr:glutathione S-transferase [Rhodospirillaceae bacterium]MDP6404678.1 glutathione S-transferase family protein [Alphaproteobacteria bacterium]MDP6622149.1 glutathione S-transferase family protein [Alphaproteobacteria bacterium]|tara:strand:- start:114 stop:713 length:600 start_codon:yes stop_codon:yes gene_type:complete
MKMYGTPVSGNCYKVRLMLSLLGRDFEIEPVSLPEGEHKTAEFLALNPLGQIPVLDDDGLVLRDSQAILVYLGAKYGDGEWWPVAAGEQGEVMQWLSFAANEMWAGPAYARAMLRFGRPGDLAVRQDQARQALGQLEGRLAAEDWLVLGRPTVADIACYPYAGLVEEAKVSLEPYPAVRAWCARIEALSGYAGMPGLGG